MTENDLLQEQSTTSSHLDATRMHLVTISLSSVLYYMTYRNSNIHFPGMILFRHTALKRYKNHKHAKTLPFEYWESGFETPLTFMGSLLESVSGLLCYLSTVCSNYSSHRFHETVSFLSPLGLMLDLAPWRSSSLKNAYTLTPQNKPAKQNEELDLPVKMQRK